MEQQHGGLVNFFCQQGQFESYSQKHQILRPRLWIKLNFSSIDCNVTNAILPIVRVQKVRRVYPPGMLTCFTTDICSEATGCWLHKSFIEIQIFIFQIRCSVESNLNGIRWGQGVAQGVKTLDY